jgi:hypothetical protein
MKMVEHWPSTKITEWKPTAFRPGRRPKVKWEDDVRQDLKVTKIYDREKTS